MLRCLMRCPLFSLVLGSWLIIASIVVAAPPRQPKLPNLQTPAAKLAYIQAIRNSFPAMKSNVRYDHEDLEKAIDTYVARETSTPFTKVVDDATFLRRVSLDATGIAPEAAAIEKFVNDKDPKKREKIIDSLVDSDDWARKQARYWRSVIFFEAAANQNTINPQAFEDWLFEEFQKGTSWDLIVAQMLSASPQRVKGKRPQDNGWQQDHGPNNFMLANERMPERIASETARLFMGISIGCAECHDHPFEDWKREQFHELAAFFAPGKYYMPGQDDPKEKSEMQARFLLGEKPPEYLKADHRRVAMAGYLMYNPDNFWFARSYVNRLFGELLGDAFYDVDSLGPDKEAKYPLIVNRLATVFRGKNFDARWLTKTIMKSRVYQRDIRTIEKGEDLFTGVRPTRLRPYEVADNVTRIVGENDNIRKDIDRVFEQNPSIPQRDIEGSMQQALLLMNNTQLQAKLMGSTLTKQLKQEKSDEKLIENAFLGILARKPTIAETSRYQRHLQQTQPRTEAVEDLVWVLMNSSEFVTKR